MNGMCIGLGCSTRRIFKLIESAFKGQVSDENLSQALEEALRQNGMFAEMEGKYTVLPSLVHLKQPALGLDMTVTAQVNYIVRDSGGKIVMEETVSTPYTATVGDAFVGVTRVRLANEGAVRENIGEFIAKLSEFETIVN